MRMRNRLLVMACLLMLVGSIGLGQEKNEAGVAPSVQTANGKHYQVVFVVQEVEGGRVINSRRYSTDMAFTGEKSGSGSIRTGSRVAVVTGSYTATAGGKTQTQFTYVNLGFNVDFDHAQLESDKVYLWLKAELIGADSTRPGRPDDQNHQPTIRNNSWSAGVTVPLGKPTVVFSSDDLDSKRTIQVELTVTPVQ